MEIRTMRLLSRPRMRNYLTELAVSEREVARLAKLSHGTVTQLITGRRVTCTVATATAIEAVLGCPGELFAPVLVIPG